MPLPPPTPGCLTPACAGCCTWSHFSPCTCLWLSHQYITSSPALSLCQFTMLPILHTCVPAICNVRAFLLLIFCLIPSVTSWEAIWTAHQFWGHITFHQFQAFPCHLMPPAFYDFWICRKQWCLVTFIMSHLLSLLTVTVLVFKHLFRHLN